MLHSWVHRFLTVATSPVSISGITLLIGLVARPESSFAIFMGHGMISSCLTRSSSRSLFAATSVTGVASAPSHHMLLGVCDVTITTFDLASPETGRGKTTPCWVARFQHLRLPSNRPLRNFDPSCGRKVGMLTRGSESGMLMLGSPGHFAGLSRLLCTSTLRHGWPPSRLARSASAPASTRATLPRGGNVPFPPPPPPPPPPSPPRGLEWSFGRANERRNGTMAVQTPARKVSTYFRMIDQ